MLNLVQEFFSVLLSSFAVLIVGRYGSKVLDRIENKLLDKKNGRSYAEDDHSSKN